MMSNKGDAEEHIQCPYNSSHLILHHRMQTHLVKCKRNYPKAKLVDCHFNSVHQIPEPELGYHHENCPDRIGIEKHIIVAETADINKFPIPDLNIQKTEVWDDECNGGYDPEQHCMNNPILRSKKTLSAAQRRHFRMEERQRMQQFSVNENDNQENHKKQPEEARPRRPVTESAGVKNCAKIEDNLYDINTLMEKVKLGSNKITIPKFVSPDIVENADVPQNNRAASGKSTGAIPRTPMRTVASVVKPEKEEYNVSFVNDESFPCLGEPRSKTAPIRGRWGAASLALQGIASSAGKPQVRGRGRGSSLAQ